MNPAALKILGKTMDEVVGRRCDSVWRADICSDERCTVECMKRGIKESKFIIGDSVFVASASYIKDIHGKNIGHVEVILNITNTD